MLKAAHKRYNEWQAIDVNFTLSKSFINTELNDFGSVLCRTNPLGEMNRTACK